jgi:hypothetical protein
VQGTVFECVFRGDDLDEALVLRVILVGMIATASLTTDPLGSLAKYFMSSSTKASFNASRSYCHSASSRS